LPTSWTHRHTTVCRKLLQFGLGQGLFRPKEPRVLRDLLLLSHRPVPWLRLRPLGRAQPLRELGRGRQQGRGAARPRGRHCVSHWDSDGRTRSANPLCAHIHSSARGSPIGVLALARHRRWLPAVVDSASHAAAEATGGGGQHLFCLLRRHRCCAASGRRRRSTTVVKSSSLDRGWSSPEPKRCRALRAGASALRIHPSRARAESGATGKQLRVAATSNSCSPHRRAFGAVESVVQWCSGGFLCSSAPPARPYFLVRC
jgi:hypothetical protein